MIICEPPISSSASHMNLTPRTREHTYIIHFRLRERCAHHGTTHSHTLHCALSLPLSMMPFAAAATQRSGINMISYRVHALCGAVWGSLDERCVRFLPNNGRQAKTTHMRHTFASLWVGGVFCVMLRCCFFLCSSQGRRTNQHTPHCSQHSRDRML